MNVCLVSDLIAVLQSRFPISQLASFLEDVREKRWKEGMLLVDVGREVPNRVHPSTSVTSDATPVPWLSLTLPMKELYLHFRIHVNLQNRVDSSRSSPSSQWWAWHLCLQQLSRSNRFSLSLYLKSLSRFHSFYLVVLESQEFNERNNFTNQTIEEMSLETDWFYHLQEKRQNETPFEYWERVGTKGLRKERDQTKDK